MTPDPQWMLAHAIRLDPRVLTLAACACARLALPVAGNHPDLVAALDAAEAWARREGTLGALRQTLRPCWRACDQFSSGSRAVQAGLAAFFAAESADPRADHYQAPEVAWRTAHALFRGDWRRDPLVYDPRIVEAVHRFVALGPVLLSKLSGVDPTWPRKDLPDGP